MQKKVFIVIGIMIIISLVILFFVNKNSQENLTPTPHPTSSPLTTSQDCTNNQLSATATSEGAAGSIYTTLTITNISDKDCIIYLGNSIKASFSAGNISTKYNGNDGLTAFTLIPQTKIYSQVRYPNGPQCQNGIITAPVALNYEANSTKIDFKDANGNSAFNITACKDINESTVIDIWGLSENTIN